MKQWFAIDDVKGDEPDPRIELRAPASSPDISKRKKSASKVPRAIAGIPIASKTLHLRDTSPAASSARRRRMRREAVDTTWCGVDFDPTRAVFTEGDEREHCAKCSELAELAEKGD